MVTINDFHKIQKLLNSINWYIKESSTRQDRIFNSIYELIRKVNSSERDIIYSLTQKIENITYTQLNNFIPELLSDVPKNYFEVKEIYVIPIAGEKDSQNVKSGSNIANFLKSSLQIDIQLPDKVLKIEYLNNVGCLEQFNQRDESLILFCDEFIGSGKQALKCIKWYSKYKKSSDKMILFSVFALESGIQKITKNKIPIFCKRTLKKGISDDQILAESNAKDIMIQLEKKNGDPFQIQLRI